MVLSGYPCFLNIRQINSYNECIKAFYPGIEIYLYECSTPNGQHFIAQLSEEEEKKKLIPPSPEPTLSDETANWKTYPDDLPYRESITSKFTFRYPSDWVVSQGDFIILLPKFHNDQIQSGPSKMEEETYPREKYSPITISNVEGIPTYSSEATKVIEGARIINGKAAKEYRIKYIKATKDYSIGHESLVVLISSGDSNDEIWLHNINFKDTFDQILATFKFLE